MKRFTLALAAALAFVNFSTAAAPVEVLKAHNYTMSRYGQSTQYLGATVSVDNLAYSKVVEIVYRDSDNQWKAVPATYRHGSGNNKEVWEAGWTRTTAGASPVPAINLEFAVKYQVNGQTYWDNNSGQNHKVNLNTGEYVTKQVVSEYARANKPYAANGVSYPGNLYVSALAKNLSGAQEVKIHYSYNNWATTHVQSASSLSSRTYGYAYLTYPNANGVKFWQLNSNSAVHQNTTASQVKYAISYKVNGVTYWDNNYGLNYTISR